MQTTVPLTSDQIKIAGHLHGMLEQWVATDSALFALAERFPGFDADASLLKVVTLNSLYVTQVFAVVRMARHVQNIMQTTDPATVDEKLVGRLASLPPSQPHEHSRLHLSFASKFAHFFVNAERFPILDSYAEQMVNLHLGLHAQVGKGLLRYTVFVQNLARLRTFAGWNGTNRELDHYLWLTGQYRIWRRNPKAEINAELKRFFASPSSEAMTGLNALLPSILDKAFKGEL